MAVKLVGQNYLVKFRGDGSSTTFDVDLYDMIQSDNTVHNKTPDGVIVSGGVTATLSGTVVSLTWSTPIANNQQEERAIQLTFPK